MRDRLIELLRQIDFEYSEECQFAFEDGYKSAPDFAEFFADHLLAEGVIVPPCKVGDIVYTTLWHYEITNITITQNKKGVWTKKYRAMKVVNGKTIDWQLNFAFDDIGKTVFLTKEEAEKALAERSENGK